MLINKKLTFFFFYFKARTFVSALFSGGNLLLFAFPIGVLADNVGLKTIFIIGLALFAIVYFGMAVNTNLYFFFGLFFLYGIYASATEGISKAWISNITDKKDTATAIGTFSGLQSICTMLATSTTSSRARCPFRRRPNAGPFTPLRKCRSRSHLST